jgi:multisubunit Na+/H+ antiporter MnhB subunit
VNSSTIIKLGMVGCLVVLALLIAGMVLMPEYGKPKLDSANWVLKNAVPATGAANIVCSVVLDIRGYDTLGEATLLLAAVTGVVVLLGKASEEKEVKA